jgi:recombinational DNA repair ATPase RecF
VCVGCRSGEPEDRTQIHRGYDQDDCFQVESRLLGLLSVHYSRTEDEGRRLLQAAFQSKARLEVRDDKLYVELAPQSSPHRTKAIAGLSEELNTLDAQFPGTHLRLRLGI